MKSSRLHHMLFAILFFYFIVRLLFIATKVGPEIPPDETTHVGICQLFSKSFIPPGNSSESYSLGQVSDVPVAYYFIMGQLLNFNLFFDSDLLYLRVLNIIFAGFTVIFAWKWIAEITQNLWAQSLFILMLTNTMMWTFLSATVSYDNLANLTAAAALYYLFHFFNARNPLSFVAFLIALGIGGLTKVTLLPFGFALCVVFLIREGGMTLGLMNRPALLLRWYSGSAGIGLLLALCLWGGNVYLYGSNVLKYGHLVPQPEQVFSEAELMQNRVQARNHIANEFRDGKLTFDQAINRIQHIPHQEDQKGAFQLVYFSQQLKTGEKTTHGLTPFLNYLGRWTATVAQSTFGVMGHQILYVPLQQLWPMFVVWALAVGLFLTMQAEQLTRHDKRVGNWGHLYASLGIFLFYAAVLYYMNYRSYVATGHPSAAVQGRYLFPVLIPIYGWAACQLIGYGPKLWRISIGVLAAGVFVYYDFPWFLQHLPANWSIPG